MKYVSGRLRKLELGLSSHSETKQTLNVIGNADITGIASASAFADFDYLQTPYGSTVSFTVTVAAKSGHRYQGQGSGNAYLINGVQAPVLTLTPGRTYRFTNDNTGSHPLKFYYEADKTTEYTTGVSFQNTYTEITVSDTTPNVLHYQCTSHQLMGNAVVTNSNVVDSPYAATLRDSLTVSGNITANGNILGDNVTNISGINSVTATSFFGDGSGLVDVSIPGISTAGTTEFTHLELSGNLKVAGVSTFGNDKVIVGGATTDLLVNGSARVTGELKVGDGTITLNSAGLSTFPTGVDVSGGSGLIASSAKISDLTSGRIVFAGAGGELEDSANLTFDGTTLSGSFSGDGSGLTGVSIPGINTSGTTEFTNLDLSGTLKVAGVSTFSGNINANGNIVGDNSTNITGIAGVTATTLAGTLQTAAQPNITSLGTLSSLTVSGAIDANGSLDVDGHTELDDVNVSGASTFATAKVTDLTDNRIVIAGTGGELEDTSKLTFDGTTLAIVGDATFTGNVSVAGTLTSEDKTNVDSLGIVTARTGVRISSGGLVVSSGVATFTDALVASTAKVSDLTDGRVVYAGANGELQDSSHLTFNGTTLNGTFSGDGTALLVTIPGISTNTTSEFTNLSVVGVLTAGSAILGSAKVTDLTSGRVVYAGNAGELQDNSTFTFNGSTVTAPAFAGDGSALTGITAGGVGAIGGLTVKDEGVVVGTAGSIATLDFLGGGVSVIASSGAAGIATVTVATVQNPDVQTLNVSGVSTFGGNISVAGNAGIGSLNVTGISTFGDDVELTGGQKHLTLNGQDKKLIFKNGGTDKLEIFHNDGGGGSNQIYSNAGSQPLKIHSAGMGGIELFVQVGAGLNKGIQLGAQGDVIPSSNNSIDLGTNNNRFGHIYGGDGIFSRDMVVGAGLSVAGVATVTGNLDLNNGLDVTSGHVVLSEGVEFKMGTSSNLEIISISGNKARIQSQQELLEICTGAPKEIRFRSDRTGTNAGWNINVDGDLIPSADSTVDIGSNTVRVQNFYADTLYGDGSNLTGITAGATLSAASGSQRLVLTSLTSGTMTSAATDADLSFDATDNLLNAGKLLIAGISTFSDDVTLTGYQKHLTLKGQDKKLIFNTSNVDKFEIFHDDGGGGSNKIYSRAGSQPLKIHTENLGGIQLYVNTGSGGGKGIQLGAQGDVIPSSNNDIDLGHINNRFGHVYGRDGIFSRDIVVGAGLSVAGVATVTGNIKTEGYFSASDDMYFIGSGGGSYTQLNTNSKDLLIDARGNSNKIMFRTASGGNNPTTTNGWDIDSSGHLLPSSDSSRDIGTNSVRVQNIYADTLYGDGSNLTNLPSSGGGGDKFNTTITNSVQATVYGYETDIISFPSDNTKRYVIESISVGNVTTGVGTTVNVIASINPGVTTYSSEYKVYLAYNVPVPDNGLVELLKEPMVVNPSDVIKVWATDETNTGINGAIELYATYTAHESTDYIAGYGSTTNITTTGIATVYTSTSYPTVVQSIKMTNRTDTGDFPITIQIVNGSTVTHLAKNLVVPRYASVELLDRPKRIETGAEIRMQQAAAANTIDVIVSGKKIT